MQSIYNWVTEMSPSDENLSPMTEIFGPPDDKLSLCAAFIKKNKKNSDKYAAAKVPCQPGLDSVLRKACVNETAKLLTYC